MKFDLWKFCLRSKKLGRFDSKNIFQATDLFSGYHFHFVLMRCILWSSLQSVTQSSFLWFAMVFYEHMILIIERDTQPWMQFI